MEHLVLAYDVCPFCVELDQYHTDLADRRKSMAGVSYYYRSLDPNDPTELRMLTDGH